MGAIRAQSSEEGTKCRATVAALFGERANSGECDLRAVGVDCLEWLEGTSVVFGIGHHSVVESLLHDSPICGVWRSSRDERCGEC